MLASWGMLAFLKAADTRQNASFAVKLDKKGEFDSEMEANGPMEPEDILDSIGVGGGAASAAARRAAAANQSRPAPSQYSYDDKKATMMQGSNEAGGHFTNKRSHEYRDQSDEEFFRNFGNARPGEDNSFEGRYEKVAPQPQPKPQPEKKAASSKKAQKSVHQSGAQRKTPVPQHKPKGRSASSGRVSQEEKIRRQREYEQEQRRRKQAQQNEESPLTLEDIFGDDHK